MPGWALVLTALTVPGLEILAGACLCLGFLTRSAGLVTAFLGTTYALVTASALVRGLTVARPTGRTR